MKKQPLLIMLVCFIAGILFMDEFNFGKKYVFALLLVGISLPITGFSKNYHLLKYQSFGLGFFFFSIGVFCHYFNNLKPVLPNFEGEQHAIFQLDKKLNSNEKNRRYVVSFIKIEGLNPKYLPLNSVISLPKNLGELNYNNYYQTKLYLNRVLPPDYGFLFNYAKYLSRQQIYYQGFLTNKVFKINKTHLSFIEKVKQKRLDLLQKIDETKNLSPPSKNFLKGIILADRTEMNSDMISDFQNSGLIHLLAISGTHMVIIFIFVFWFFKNIFPVKKRNLALILTLIFIWLFAWFIGFGSSVTRACLMISIYQIYVIQQKKTDLLQALALSAFIILIVDSNQFFDVGFQLSYAAVLGIFWLNQPIIKLFPKNWLVNNIQRNLIKVFSITNAAQIGTLPLVIYYFHQYSYVSLIANLIIIPLSEFIIVFSFIMVVFSAINFNFLNSIYDFLIEKILKLIHWFSSFHEVLYKNIPMSLIEVILLSLLVYFTRFLLIKFNFRNVYRFLVVLLMFFAIRIGLNLFYFEKNEILPVNYFKDNVILIKNKGHVLVGVKENLDLKKIEKYIIDPYLTSRRTKGFKIFPIPKNTNYIVVNGKTYALK